MCFKKIKEQFNKFKNRKYFLIPDGKSNLTAYDKKLFLAMFFANITITAFAVMAIGSYWSKQTEVYKDMSARCTLLKEIRKGTARMDSEIEMLNAKRKMQNSSIGIKIEPTKKPRKYIPGLIKEYEEKFLNKQ